ncbi:MAG: hypothetical protein ACM3N4_01675 [Nitrososphaerota archaeon]
MVNNMPVARPALATDSTSSTPATTRLSGGRLLAVRMIWFLLVVVALAPFLIALSNYRASIEHPSSDNAALPPGAADALARAGIGLDVYAWVSVGVVCVVLLVSVAIALLLAWRRSDDWMALLVSVFVVVYTTSNIGLPTNAPSVNPDSLSGVALAMLVSQQNVPAVIIPFAVFLLFPSGRFVPRWSRLLFGAAVAWAVGIAIVPQSLGGVLFLGYPLFIGVIIACMIYRYRCASTSVQRQQTKWVIAGLVVSLVVNQAFWIPSQFTPLGQTLYPPLSFLVYQLVLLAVPVVFLIAILRYRLYDIDIIIRRTLIYGSLTVILAVVYVGGVIGVQAFVNALANTPEREASPVLVVVTTLVIAALFQPLRRRVQRVIDKRFYRRKYDSRKTLEAFSATLRQQVDLATLTGQLVTVVDETMQPAHVSLWLRESEGLP